MTDYSERIAKLTPEKRALLELKLKQKTEQALPPIISRYGSSDDFPLSFAQERLWSLDQSMPGNAFYNIPGVIAMAGPLDAGVLYQSINQIVKRHTVLRTVFATKDGKPYQVIAPNLDIPLPLVNLQALPEGEKLARLNHLAKAEATEPFDLMSGPLLRTQLLRFTETENILLITLHHIICDGWSISVFLRELTTIYRALAANQPAQLPDLPIQYVDFACWQREWMQGEVLEKQLGYWTKHLAGAPPLLKLPTDYPRPPVQTFRGATYRSTIPEAVIHNLKILSNQQGVTLFMTLATAFQLLLQRYTGQDDLVIGIPVANRNHTELENLIGFFVNSLALRTDLSGNPTFIELLERVREVTLNIYTYQDLPFEKLVEALKPKRVLSHAPIFQVMFQLQNVPTPSLELGEVTLKRLPADSGTTQLDLSVDLGEREDGFVISVEYATDLFVESTIIRLVEHFKNILEGIITNPRQHLLDIPLLNPEERRQTLVAWNDTEVAFPDDQGILHLFADQVKRNPEAAAVLLDGKSLSYKELNHRANQLAAYLHQIGVRPETRAGLCVEPALEMVVGVLGILKAGGTYVPLDPTYPQERLNFILKDAQVTILLTQQRLIGTFPGYEKQVICLDSDWPTIEQTFKTAPDSPYLPNSAAYIIYTSGSTGKPKGVVVPHRALVNHSRAVIEQFDIQDSDNILQFAALNFDVAAEEIFPSLLAGATVVVPSSRLIAPGHFLNLIKSNRITILNLPASYWHEWIEELSRAKENLPTFLRLIVIGSEKVLAESIAKWHHLEGARSLWLNAYGTTESTISTTFYKPPLRLEERRFYTNVPIGKPIMNARVYLLDGQRQPVPIGVSGELYIGGCGIARGYLNMPALTAEKFLPDPFSSQPGARLYKTGDLARYLPDGNIEHLGRLDQQIKLRGYRIEPAEIESLLQQHQAVQRAVVLTNDDNPDQKQLVAYVQPHKTQTPFQAQLEAEWVARWQKVHDGGISGEIAQGEDPTFDTSGWRNSYQGQSFTLEEIREQVDGTAERILALQPKRVLEIGCGRGLVLFRIASHCSDYWGTDFSVSELTHLQNHIQRSSLTLPQITLLQKEADDFEGLTPQSFDIVILDSTIQYFPSVAYLLRVLEGAIQMVRDGGYVFIGDVRSLPLLEAFATSVEIEQAPAALNRTQLSQRIRTRMLQEPELIVDPAFFVTLTQHFPRLGHVDIQLKPGYYHNELTKYRYDVTLYISPQPYPIIEPMWLDWQTEQLSTVAIAKLLETQQPEQLGICGIPNARLTKDLRMVQWLKEQGIPDTVGALRDVLALEEQDQNGTNPQEMWTLGRELGYTTHVFWMPEPAHYAVHFQKSTQAALVQSLSLPSKRPWHAYANNPLQTEMPKRLIPELLNDLKRSLPAFMIPSAVILLDEWPLMPNGKLNRQALPAPNRQLPELSETYVPPQSALEQAIAAIWREVLQKEKIGIHDNFFDVGGHSILLAQTHSKLNQTLNREVTIVELLQHPTIGTLANYLCQNSDEQSLLLKSQKRAETRLASSTRAENQRLKRRRRFN